MPLTCRLETLSNISFVKGSVMKNSLSTPSIGCAHTAPLKQRLSVVWLLSVLWLPLVLALPARAQIQFAPTVYTYAGGATAVCANATDTIGDGCVATSAVMGGSGSGFGTADAEGNIYFPDAKYDVIRRIDTTTGIVTLFAGQIGVKTSTTPLCAGDVDKLGDGCLATQAIFNIPRCVRFDHAGNLIVADASHQVIRSIDKTTHIVSVLMGKANTTSAKPPSNSATTLSTPSTTVLDNPFYMEFDPAGNMIVTNSSGNFATIALAVNGLIDPVNSVVYTLAGTGVAKATGGNNGLATAATFSGSRGIGIDASENIYIAEFGGYEIRRISSPGVNGQVTLNAINSAVITDYAGNGTNANAGDGGLATAAEITAPEVVAFDNAGNVLIGQNPPTNVVRSVNPTTNIISTYAGSGVGSFSGDGGPAAQAAFNGITGMKVNLAGRISEFDDTNNRIRNIYPVPFFLGSSVGSTTASQNVAIQATAAVTASTTIISNSEFTIGAPSGCTLGQAIAANAYCTFPIEFIPAGPGLRSAQLQITDSNGHIYNDALLGVGLAPAAAFYGAPVTTITGNGTSGSSGNLGAASAALVNAPRGGAFDTYGNFYFADSGNNVIREVSKKAGTITIVAGTGTGGYSGDSGAATSAQLKNPTGIAIDPAGNLYIADAGNNRIREVNANTGIITTIAGTGTASYTGDAGLASAATLNNPSGVAIDNAGILYVADTGNNALRAFVPNTGIIVTLAGDGTAGYSGDGGVPQLAELNAPTAVTVDVAGNIYVADTGNAIIRRIVPTNSGIINFQANISTYAGTAGGDANSGDGSPAATASLLTPSDVGVDAAGNLYIASGGQVRMVNASSGIIATIAGTGASGNYSGDGDSALETVLPSPANNLAVDQIGNIYLSDTAGNRVVQIAGSTAATIAFGSQTINQTSAPQSVTLYNSGNQNLTLTNIAVPAGFALSNSTSNPCTSPTVLAPSGTCTLTATFSPTTLANYNSQITITDNALNNVAATQVIQLTGTGVAHLNQTTTTITYLPANLIYGGSVNVTATIAGGTNTSGNVNFVINSTTTVTVPVVSGQASYQLTGLHAGPDSVTANYLGDTVNASSSGNVSFSLQPAVITVTANSLSGFPAQALPTFTYTFSGFVNNDTAATAITGVPTLSTTATATSSVGSYPITISQGSLAAANYTFVFVAGTYTITPPNFALSASPTSLTIASGQVGVDTVTIIPSVGYAGTVNLSCGPLPAAVVCKFTSPSNPINGGPLPTQLTISTNNRPEISSLRTVGPWSSRLDHTRLLSLAFGFPLLSLTFFFRRNTRWRRILSGVTAVLIFVAIQNLNGCSEPTKTAAPFSGTITIIGTDNNNVSAQATLNLTIQ
jgi:sugar lactone lactonase YvrE